MLEILTTIGELRERLKDVRRRGASIGFVPTMGALHAGHAKLLDAARGENDFVVASIFVNPLQFDRKEDLERYPRTAEADAEICNASSANVIYSPAIADLYPGEQLTFVDAPALTAHLCGEHRPGHFRGVATVVLKLFHIVQPDRAYFGEKDAQQLAVIQRMVQDLNVPVTIVPVATVREADGLALSSRNKHLTPPQREIAPVLSRALYAAAELIEGGQRSVLAIRESVLAMFAPYPAARVEYLEVVDLQTLTPVTSVEGPVLIAGAMWLGSTRLIDNVRWPRSN